MRTVEEIKEAVNNLIDHLEYVEANDAIKILLVTAYSIAKANDVPIENLAKAIIRLDIR